MFSGLIGWWSDLYFDQRWLSVIVHFLHLAALLVGGGAALYLDRRVLAVRRAVTAERREVLVAIQGIHPLVISALIVVGFTGVLMTVADADIFLSSVVYWLKMSLVALLVVNGLLVVAAEKRVGRLGEDVAWSRLAVFSVVSIILWLALLFMGTLLRVVA